MAKIEVVPINIDFKNLIWNVEDSVIIAYKEVGIISIYQDPKNFKGLFLTEVKVVQKKETLVYYDLA